MYRLSVVVLTFLAGLASGVRLPGWAGAACPKVKSGGVIRDRDGRLAFSADAKGGIAWGSYQDSMHSKSNFGQLRVSTSGVYGDAEQLAAAGFLEGYLTAERVWDNYVNMRDYFLKGMGAEIEEPMLWIQKQDRWLRKQCEAAAAGGGVADSGERPGSTASPRFWDAVCLLLHQFDGLKAGYRARREAVLSASASASGGGGSETGSATVGDMSDWDFLFLESNGDLYDIIDAQQPDQRPSWVQGAEPVIPTVRGRAGGRHWRQLEEAVAADPKAAAAKLFSKVALSGKCSALIKVAPDLSDIWMGHSTWDTFTAMLRIYKHYSFDLRQLRPAANRLSFSSYPGELFSDDDFFLTSAGLVILQTTNKIFNDELFDRLDPHTVLSWQRVRAANWLADDGQAWAGVLDTLNSGTYNNQYMIVDLKRFSPGEELQEGLLWVAEQVPGLVAAADLTPTLAFGYFPSYNVPYFPEVYNASGYPDFVSKLERYGQHFGLTTHWLSYQNSPRAKIFRRDQAGISDLAGMRAVMRSNRWKTDPFSEGHPICAVCGRGDLDPSNPVPRGCFDTKVTSYSLALKMQAEAVNGPTSDSWPWSVPPFHWSEAVVANLTHRGQPERFAFHFERMDPEASASGRGCAARQQQQQQQQQGLATS
ncbi:hypothetical protein D9Q98_009920 [Chlorella vulgaris]|uniref:Phospholipase B-like n=1 Tax=Chlorella vulgaris TaxID=3077 RepID=A0A9D4TFR5_CHLVU|nr:hypothetical protein D9Q98_009920 [Chlorella vulgaris]